MSSELLNPEVLEQAVQNYLAKAKDPEARRDAAKVQDNLHLSESWEGITDLVMMGIIKKLGLPEGKNPDDTKEKYFSVHELLMNLVAVAFQSGFDAGYKLQIEHLTRDHSGLA